MLSSIKPLLHALQGKSITMTSSHEANDVGGPSKRWWGPHTCMRECFQKEAVNRSLACMCSSRHESTQQAMHRGPQIDARVKGDRSGHHKHGCGLVEILWHGKNTKKSRRIGCAHVAQWMECLPNVLRVLASTPASRKVGTVKRLCTGKWEGIENKRRDYQVMLDQTRQCVTVCLSYLRRRDM